MNTNGQRRAFFGSLCAMMLCGMCLRAEGQEQSVKSERHLVIKVGQMFDDAKEILGKRDIEWSIAHLQWARAAGGDDEEVEDPISFSLGEDSVDFILFHSTAERRIGRILMLITPPNGGRADEIYLWPKSIVLDSDGSYAVHFPPPAKDRGQPDRTEADKARPGPRPKSKYPR